MQRRWVLQPQDQDLQKQLATSLKVSPLIAQILINRQITDLSIAQLFLHGTLADLPDPFLLKDMTQAVTRLHQALLQKESILLYGDYDVDGTTGVALLYTFLINLGANVHYQIPDRAQDGYGLNKKAVDDIVQQGHHLMVTIDNGTASMEELKSAEEQGLEVIVIDHHECPKEDPPVLALINPKHPTSQYPDINLASVGLCFNVAVALRSYLRKQNFFQDKTEPNLKHALDLVALGTVADLVPLTGVNRLLVRYGLEEIKTGRHIGLRALAEVSGTARGDINAGALGFRLGPRINAAGRMAHAHLAVELLTTHHPGEAKTLAEKLDHLNRQRQSQEETIVKAALSQAEQQGKQAAYVVSATDWHPGVIGIVASKLVEAFHRPACVIAIQDGIGKASLRSISGCPLYDILTQCQNTLIRFGGHQMAAGLTIAEEHIETFTALFQKNTQTYLNEDNNIPILKVDAPLSIQDISSELLEALDTLTPHGYGNPEPSFLLENLQLEGAREVGKNHLKTNLKQGALSTTAIGFGLAADWLNHSENCSVVGLPQWNEWQGQKNLQIKIKDIHKISNLS